jgi:hypothetical protein
MTMYRAWALIIAPFLPAVRVDFSVGTYLEPLNDIAQLQRWVNEGPSMGLPTGGLHFFSAVPGRRQVRSTSVLWMTADAGTQDAALTIMLSEQLAPVLTALSEPEYPPARAEVQGIGEMDVDGRVRSFSSTWSYSTATSYAVRPTEDLESLKARYRVGRDDEVLHQASVHFADALELDDLASFHQRAIGNVILNYFLVVERIARAVVPEAVEGPDVDHTVQELLVDLAQELERARPIRQRVAAVRRTMAGINGVSKRHLAEQIQRSALQLGVADEHRDEALQVQKIRNRFLGHAGALQAIELSPHREKMRSAALAFLDGYAEFTVPMAYQRQPRAAPSTVTLELGNNHLQERHAFSGPTAPWRERGESAPGRTGRLQVTVSGPEEYAALKRLLEHHYASALMTDEGDSWHVQIVEGRELPRPDAYPADIAVDVVEVPPPGPVTVETNGTITCDQCGRGGVRESV